MSRMSRIRRSRSRRRWLRTALVVATMAAAGGSFAGSAGAAGTVPGAPTGLAASVSGTSVILTWTNATGSLGVNVYRDTSTKFWAGGYPNPTPTTYTNTSVPAGTHTYAVADYNSAGQGPLSSTVSVTVGGTSSAPTVSGISPTSGPTAGGTTVTITGTNLSGATAVAFGPTAAAGFTVNGTTSITTTSPAASAGTVDVTVTTPNGTSATNAADQFTYNTGPPPAPTVTLVNPVTGPAGTSVTVSGTNFTGATVVDFGANAATFTVNNSTTITATAPAGTGSVDVTVTTPGGTSATNANDNFTYGAGTSPGPIPSPVAGGWQLNGSAKLVTSATPANLQLTAATNTQAGSAFWPTAVPGVGISAAFDAFIGSGSGADGLTFTLADASVTKATALGVDGGGEGFSGIKGLAVSLDTYKNSVNPSSNFVGVATGPGPTADTLNYVTTNSSIPSLRNAVHHFVVTTFSTGLSLTMDGTQVLNYATSLPSSVLVGFTGGTGGLNDIHQVQNVSITAGPPPPAPTVSGISPTSGSYAGGNPVTITGTNFTGASSVSFGGMAAPSFTVASDTSITTTSPSGTGTVDVTVTTSGGTSAANSSDQFTYNPPPAPVVSGISPTSGPSGTSVTITGSRFTGASAVDFGSGNSATFKVNGDTQVTATAPSGSGTVYVTVTTAGGTSATSSADRYTYTLPPAPTVTNVNPTSGPNGTSVTITGTNLTGTTAVDFGTSNPAATFAVVNATSVTATSPAGTGTVDVTVTTSGGTSATNANDQYTYTTGPPPPPTLVATYRGGLDRTGYYPSQTGLTTANAASLKLHWSASGGGGSFAQPIVANNLVYWEDWKGLVHGTDLTGKDTWTSNVGTNTDTTSNCSPTTAGPSGTPIAGLMGSTPVLFVPGGNDDFYALNALTGALIWKTNIASQNTHFLWSSPTLYNGNIYEGVASFGDCPLVQGQLVELNGSTGAFLHTFNTVSSSCPGGGVWGSPTVDTSDSSIYIVTGNPSCGGTPNYAPAIVKLSASTLSYISSWNVPTSSQSAGDADFGSTPVLFTATINGTLRSLVGAVNKDAIFYAWDRTNVGAGPVWQSTIATASGSPATGSIVSAAWDGAHLYVAGGNTSINGTSCTGSIDELNPATGAFVWRTCQASHMYGGITVVPGVLVEGLLNGNVLFLNTATGATLFAYKAASGIQGESSVSNGIVYVPVGNGSIIALGQ